ncbi:hypothetical protein JCM19235_7025 [Vibrio maritimus]|uniref:Uncharacterized protein n=1 Tax=Vibrio maritimus TaxID=990268 RepID=A0A090SA47_9VIBR|nr:hypothetical protein JCM19235_7025 [Vibrio maritimus]
MMKLFANCQKAATNGALRGFWPWGYLLLYPQLDQDHT